ncbi:protoglobin domain-containing protein [Streptomyces sp. NPDC002076]
MRSIGVRVPRRATSPLRHLLAFTAPVVLSTKPFLQGHGHSQDEAERMYAAWTKAVVLHVTLWARAYTGPDDR